MPKMTTKMKFSMWLIRLNNVIVYFDITLTTILRTLMQAIHLLRIAYESSRDNLHKLYIAWFEATISSVIK
jgi:hypothetical protein